MINDDDKIHEECGVVGIYHKENCMSILVTALHALQHRGQESAGIAMSNGQLIKAYRKTGLVSHLASKVRYFKDFDGHLGVGHTRYSTTGSSNLLNSQPILIDFKNGQLAVAHNGNLTNAQALRTEMERKGSIFQSTNDSEVFLHLIARSQKRSLHEMILEALRRVEGAYSLVFLAPGMLIAARDPFGVRPLALGKMKNGYMIASETCAFDIVGAEYVREIAPGEILIIDKGGLKSHRFAEKKKQNAHCVFEFIYFSRPDSQIFGENVDRLRRAFGRELAREHPAKADIVISVPDSSNTAALGYAQASGLPFEIGLIRNHYVGRTFITPFQGERESKVKLKFNPVRGVLKNRRVVVVEDSIVRGTTLRQLVSMLRKAGAREIHVRVSSPPIKHPCHYGMDFPSREELIANNQTIQQTGKFLGVDSLGHLSMEGVRKCLNGESANFCDACFSGNYPIRITESRGKLKFEKNNC